MKTNRRNFSILVFALLVVMLGFGMVIPVFPFLIDKLGASGSALGILVATAALTEFLFGPIWGSISDRVGRKHILMIGMFVNFLAALLLSGVLIFGGAGRLDWALVWIFVTAWIVPKLVFLALLRWRDPDLLIERVTRHKNTQKDEHIILPIYFVFAFGTFIVASLDGGRFRWAGDVPLALVIAAYIPYLFRNSLAGGAINSNPFFSAESRLQTDRAQKVTSAGPYHFIRHTAYSAAFLLWVTTGLMLESWWALIPGFLAGLMMIIRTVYEDRMLQAELPGYAGYARQVRYRLLPGIW